LLHISGRVNTRDARGNVVSQGNTCAGFYKYEYFFALAEQLNEKYLQTLEQFQLGHLPLEYTPAPAGTVLALVTT